MKRFSSGMAMLSLAAAGAQDVTVHVRGGDRPSDPDFLYVDRGSAHGTPGSLVVSGGIQVDQFQIVMRNVRLQSQPIDGGSADTPGAVILGANAYLVDLAGSSLGGGTFTPLLGQVGMG